MPVSIRNQQIASRRGVHKEHFRDSASVCNLRRANFARQFVTTHNNKKQSSILWRRTRRMCVDTVVDDVFCPSALVGDLESNEMKAFRLGGLEPAYDEEQNARQSREYVEIAETSVVEQELENRTMLIGSALRERCNEEPTKITARATETEQSRWKLNWASAARRFVFWNLNGIDGVVIVFVVVCFVRVF